MSMRALIESLSSKSGSVKIPSYLKTPKLKPYIEQGLITQKIVDLYAQANSEARLEAENQNEIERLLALRMKMRKNGDQTSLGEIEDDLAKVYENQHDRKRKLHEIAKKIEEVITKKIKVDDRGYTVAVPSNEMSLLNFPHWRETSKKGHVGKDYSYPEIFSDNIVAHYSSKLSR